MGDDPPRSISAGNHRSQQTVASSFSGADSGAGAIQTPPIFSPGGAPEGQQVYTTYSQQQPQQQYSSNPQHAFSMQFDMAQSQGAGRGNPYNMNAMNNALPQTNYRQGQQQFQGGAQRYGSQAGVPQPMQYAAGPGGMNPLLAQQQYYMAQQAQMGQPQYYAAPVSPSQSHGGNMGGRGTMAYYPGQMMMSAQQPQQGYYYPQAVQYQGQGMQNQMLGGQYLGTPQSQSDPQYAQQQQQYQQQSVSAGSGPPFVPPSPAEGSEDFRSNVVRGPPRKPKQSGHAIWIGNLPPQTDLMSLVHHVCKEASGLESLFLISKSNCAFANFKDETSCAAAQQKLHDSKFQTVRLVSRLRKSTVEGASGVTAPTGPAAASAAQNAGAPPRKSNEESRASEDGEHDEDATPLAGPPVVVGDNSQAPTEEADDGAQQQQLQQPGQQPQRDKFFILKSLTVEDLDLSVRTGIWATQAHNEETLNKAFSTADNVYLVFSANKSGEYFGYARMTSPINDDPAAAIEFAPKATAAAAAAAASVSTSSQHPSSPSANAAADLDLPRAIPTEPTEFAPRGRIIDDSARGTIFWEAEREESEDAADDSSSSAKSQEAGGDDSPTKAWGKPFKLEWLSTARLPFYRTRGLRNPWNSNREVKIARDGTELEPGVGRRLVGLFNGGGMAVRGGGGMIPPPMMIGPGGMGVGGNGRAMMIAGYPPPRSPYGP